MLKCFLCSKIGCPEIPENCNFKRASWSKYIKSLDLAILGEGGLKNGNKHV